MSFLRRERRAALAEAADTERRRRRWWPRGRRFTVRWARLPFHAARYPIAMSEPDAPLTPHGRIIWRTIVATLLIVGVVLIALQVLL